MRSASTSRDILPAAGRAPPEAPAPPSLEAPAPPSAGAAADLGQVPVRQVMSPAAGALAPEVPLAEARRRLLLTGGGRLPVVGPAGQPLGIVGKADVLDAMDRGLDDQTPISRVMVPFLLAVADDAPLSRAIALMAFEGVQCLGVLDGRRRLAGMVGAKDVMVWLGGRGPAGA